MTKQRFFWDSKLAMWLEEKICILQCWYTDKRYPVDAWSAELQPDTSYNPPIIDDTYSSVSEQEVKINTPKAKKPRKKRTKKTA